MPGRLMSYAYFARPVALTGPSMRLTLVPISVGFSGHAYFSCLVGTAAARTSGTWRMSSATGHPLRLQGRFQHANVGPAAADVAVEMLARLLRCWIGDLLEQR